MVWKVSKSILVPFDFSEHCHLAVDKAIELAETKSLIHILHILPTYVPLVPEGIAIDAIDDRARIEMAAKSLNKEFEDSRYAGIVKEVLVGDPGTECSHKANEISAELIIVPSHGRRGITRLLLGSVAERIIRLANCPVLVLKMK